GRGPRSTSCCANERTRYKMTSTTNNRSPRERGCQEIRRYPADLSFSSFPRKRGPTDFSHLPPVQARGKLWAPAFAGATIGGCYRLDYSLESGGPGLPLA